MFVLGSRIIGIAKTTCMDIQARFSAVLKVSKVVKWSRIQFCTVSQIFLAIPIMNPLTRVHDIVETIVTVDL